MSKLRNMKKDGRKRAPQLLPRTPLKLTNAAVKRTIEMFERNGRSFHTQNAGTLQYIIDYCEQERINYVIIANPEAGYTLYKQASDYTSHGDPETTKAVRFLLDKSFPSRFGGPHRWNNRMLRFVGKMMRDYALYYYKQNFQIGL